VQISTEFSHKTSNTLTEPLANNAQLQSYLELSSHGYSQKQAGYS